MTETPHHVCDRCQHPTDGEITWLGEPGEEICQLCWELDCDKLWWIAVGEIWWWEMAMELDALEL